MQSDIFIPNVQAPILSSPKHMAFTNIYVRTDTPHYFHFIIDEILKFTL